MSTSPLKADSRSEFEAACRAGLLNGGLAKFDDGRYVSSLTDSVWRGWKAGRAAIVVELPATQHINEADINIPDEADWPDGFNAALEQCADALRAAGITVKGDSE